MTGSFSLMRLVFAFVLFLLAPLAGTSFAQEDLDTYRSEIEDRRLQLALAEAELATSDKVNLIELRGRVRGLLLAAERALTPVAGMRDRFKAELDAIGPAPEEGQPPETAELAENRKRVSTSFAEYDAITRQIELNINNAERLLEGISDARRDIFYDNVFRLGRSPLDPDVLAAGLLGFVQGAGDTLLWTQKEVQTRQINKSLLRDLVILGVATVFALFLFLPARRKLNRLIVGYMQANTSTPSRRVLVAGLRTAARVIPGIVGGLIVYEALKLTSLIRPGLDGDAALARAVWFAFLALITVDGAARSVFSKSVEGWEIIPLEAYKAYLMRFGLVLVTAILGADAILKAGANLLGSPQETALLQSGIVAGSLAVLVFLFTRARWTSELFRDRTDSALEPSETVSRPRFVARISIFGLLLAIVILVATLIGYVALGYFLATRVFFLVGLAAAMWCVRSVLREVVLEISNRFIPKSEVVATDDDTDSGQVENLMQFWLLLGLELIVLAAFVGPAALILGASFSDVRDTAVDAFFGFTIGTITISLADLFAGIAVFVLLLGITRFIQHTVETRLFPHTRIDPGVQHSFRTLIGYAGLVIATLAAIGAIGADLSNLAIVAGALSVGIGFGLQSIVSNFVSGLILLFERPVKVGDWIIVPSGEGYVRKISVRSTEIETFDRSSVIVPNSELIAGTVTNLTLDNKMGRVIVPVGVSYDSDPERVIEILSELAEAHPSILKNPAPMVAFVGLGDSSLDFEIRGFIRDVQTGVLVRTDLRVAIVKRLRVEGIEIPFPQRVVHLEQEGNDSTGEEQSAT